MRSLSLGTREMIKAILLGVLIRHDYLIWHFDQKGEYTIKSGYNLLLAEKIREEGSSSRGMDYWWKSLWRLHIPPKICFFMWRVFYDALFSCSNLLCRHVSLSSGCRRCENLMEDSLHALFHCQFAKTFWKHVGLWETVKQSVRNSMADSVLSIFQRVPLQSFKLFCISLWCL